MKKVALFIFLFAAGVTASAQLRLGVKVGGSLMHPSKTWSIFSINGPSYGTLGTSTYFGGYAGGYAGYAFGERLGMQGEVLISVTNALYLDIPLLVTIKPFSVLPFTLMAGGQLSMTPTLHIDGHDSNKAGSPVDFFPALAVGVQYDFGKHLNLGLRYNHGLVNEYDYYYTIPDERHTDVGFFSEKGGKHRTVQLSVGWTF